MSPPVKPYAPPTGRYFRYVWDTMGIPPVQVREGEVIYTPTFDKLVVYGREVTSSYPEDLPGIQALNARGRLMGEWFSTACPEGELGSNPLEACSEISSEEFEAASEREWR